MCGHSEGFNKENKTPQLNDGRVLEEMEDQIPTGIERESLIP